MCAIRMFLLPNSHQLPHSHYIYLPKMKICLASLRACCCRPLSLVEDPYKFESDAHFIGIAFIVSSDKARFIFVAFIW